jgi:hypothetical protein
MDLDDDTDLVSDGTASNSGESDVRVVQIRRGSVAAILGGSSASSKKELKSMMKLEAGNYLQVMETMLIAEVKSSLGYRTVAKLRPSKSLNVIDTMIVADVAKKMASTRYDSAPIVNKKTKQKKNVLSDIVTDNDMTKRIVAVGLTLSEVGPDMDQGASSTWLGLLFLIDAGSEIFRTFFWVSKFVMLCAVANGFIFTSAILILFGGEALHHFKTGDAESSKEDKDALDTHEDLIKSFEMRAHSQQ